MSNLSIMDTFEWRGLRMKFMSAKDAKNGFGLLIDTALVEPVTIEKHGRPVVVVVSIEEFERLSDAAAAKGHRSPPKGTQKKDT